MNYQVREGKERVFEDAFHGVLQAMQDMPGHIRTQLYRDLDNPRSYMICSEWESREAFNTFMGSERFTRVAHWGAEEVLEGRPQHEIFER